MILDLRDCDPLCWVWHQDLVQQVSALLGHLHMGWELILHLKYSLQTMITQQSEDHRLSCIRTPGEQGLHKALHNSLQQTSHKVAVQVQV